MSLQMISKLKASVIRHNYGVHNFTKYHHENKNVHCYWFDEYTPSLIASMYLPL